MQLKREKERERERERYEQWEGGERKSQSEKVAFQRGRK